MMLAGGGDFKPLSLLSPSSAQMGMQAKAGLILKNDGLMGLEVVQFFLTPGENGERPRPELEDKHNRPVSNCNLSDGASIVPAAPLASLQNAFSGALPEWAHPRPLGLDQILGEVFPDLALAVP